MTSLIFQNLSGLIFLFNLHTCTQINKARESSLENKFAPRGIWDAEWSSDGQYFAVGGDDSTIWIYESKDHVLLTTYKSNSMVKGLSWHPKENLLAIANMKGVQILDMKNNRLNTIPNLQTGGRGIDWNASGELLALADGRGIVQLFNKEGHLIRSISKHDNKSYLGIDWHPTKDIIVTVSNEIILFDTSGTQLQFIKHREQFAGILSVQWHPSGEFFAIGDYGHEKEGIPTLLQFWKEDGTLLKAATGHHAEIRNLSWNKDGSLLATASDALRIWNKNGELMYTGESNEILWGIAWSRDSKSIVTGSYANGKVKLWNDHAQLIRELNR